MRVLLTLGFSLVLLLASAQKSTLFSKVKNTPSSHDQKVSSAHYTFQKTMGTYTELSGATDPLNGQIWDDPEIVVPIGFSAFIMGEHCDALDFRFGLGAEILGVKSGEPSSDRPLLLPFGVDVIDRGSLGTTSLSTITYQTSGTAGSRIFTLQWKNAGFYFEGDSLGTFNDFVNFQLRLFEATGVIEFHIGPNSVQTPATAYEGEDGAWVGMVKVDTVFFTNYDFLLLNGPANNPVMDTSIATLIGTPDNGTIYRFTPGNIGLGEKSVSDGISLFPNPASGIVRIGGLEASDIKSVDIYDLTGVRVIRTAGSEEIDVSELEPGNYLIRISGPSGSETRKLIKN